MVCRRSQETCVVFYIKKIHLKLAVGPTRSYVSQQIRAYIMLIIEVSNFGFLKMIGKVRHKQICEEEAKLTVESASSERSILCSFRKRPELSEGGAGRRGWRFGF